MRAFSALALSTVMVAAVAVMWVDARWPTAVPEVVVCCLAAVWMTLSALGRAHLRLSAVMLPLAGILLLAQVQLLSGTTVYRWQTQMAILYWAGNLAAFFVGLQIFSDEILRTRFLRGLVVFGFVIGVVSPLQALTTNGKIFWIFQTTYTSWYVFGPFVYTNQYAAFVELLLPIALYGALAKGKWPAKRKWKVFDMLTVAVLYTSVLASASRTGSLLTTLELLSVPMLAFRRFTLTMKDLVAATALLATVLLLTVALSPKLLFERFGQKDPYAIRREFLYSSANMIKDRPVLGVGLGNWATAYPGYALFDDGLYANQAHNDWAQWWVEGGVPMALMMLSVALWCFCIGVRSVWGVGIAVVFVHCFVDYPFQRTAVALVLFALMAAAACSGREAEAVQRMPA